MKTLKLICLSLLLLSFNEASAQKSKTKKSSSGYDFQGEPHQGLARVKKENKWGFIDTTGNIVIPLKYNQVENFVDGLAKVRKGQRWGLLDLTGKVVIAPTFDWIHDFENGIAKVKLDGEEYYMNKQGQRVILNGKEEEKPAEEPE
ncbi:MAG: WG repeat-containing protein [Bacteroidota bacterium]|nr:WG repeat-containing protein [Bacteroidota bacterium]